MCVYMYIYYHMYRSLLTHSEYLRHSSMHCHGVIRQRAYSSRGGGETGGGCLKRLIT